MRQYIVDAFTNRIFHGNPAAVCVLDEWIPDALMMAITRENNFSETAFLVKQGERYRLRWFTPGGEIDLCGHATLASAFVIMEYIEKNLCTVTFSTLSGDLTVQKRMDSFEMKFPAYELRPVPVTPEMRDALGAEPEEAYLGRDLLCVFQQEDIIRNMKPDWKKTERLDGLLVHVTAPGNEADCVSRSFCPKLKIAEDPVCGSGHCHIAPYWAKRLEKTSLKAIQASERGGVLLCRVEGAHVFLAGNAVLFAVSELQLQYEY